MGLTNEDGTRATVPDIVQGALEELSTPISRFSKMRMHTCLRMITIVANEDAECTASIGALASKLLIDGEDMGPGEYAETCHEALKQIVLLCGGKT